MLVAIYGPPNLRYMYPHGAMDSRTFDAEEHTFVEGQPFGVYGLERDDGGSHSFDTLGLNPLAIFFRLGSWSYKYIAGGSDLCLYHFISVQFISLHISIL